MEIAFTMSGIGETAKKILASTSSKTLLFYGEMGVGKTTLIHEIVKALGANEALSSPTYSIVNEYEIPGDKIYHFDCYRLKDLKEAYDMGMEEYLNGDCWNLIEWPEKVEGLFLGSDTSKYKLTKDNKGKRTIQTMPMT